MQLDAVSKAYLRTSIKSPWFPGMVLCSSLVTEDLVGKDFVKIRKGKISTPSKVMQSKNIEREESRCVCD